MRRLARLLFSDRVKSPWTNVYGVARSLLALGTIFTLLTHDVDTLFRPTGELLSGLADRLPLARLNFFFLFAPHQLSTARWLAILLLVIVGSGWRPRITGLIHWWLASSFSVACVVVDGGDQVTSVLCLLLIPIALTDTRKWHWGPLPRPRLSTSGKIAALVASSAHVAIRVQVAAIYFHAAVGKLAVPEWQNGTALYYWFTHPIFGLADWLMPLFLPVLASAAGAAAMSWGVILLEFLLCAALVMSRRWWSTLLVAGLTFHLAIILVHGLTTFFLAMAAALVLYLRPADREFKLSHRLVWRRLPAGTLLPAPPAQLRLRSAEEGHR